MFYIGLPGGTVVKNPPANEETQETQVQSLGREGLLQGIFPTQGSNPGLLNCMQTLYCLSHQRSLSWEPRW